MTRIRSGGNLDEVAFPDRHITYHQLRQIDWNANPQFVTELSQHADNNYKQPHLEDFGSQEEEEGKETNSLPIPEPLGTHLRIMWSGHNSGEQSSESMRDRLEEHLGTIIGETIQLRTTLESE